MGGKKTALRKNASCLVCLKRKGGKHQKEKRNSGDVRGNDWKPMRKDSKAKGRRQVGEDEGSHGSTAAIYNLVSRTRVRRRIEWDWMGSNE